MLKQLFIYENKTINLKLMVLADSEALAHKDIEDYLASRPLLEQNGWKAFPRIAGKVADNIFTYEPGV